MKKILFPILIIAIIAQLFVPAYMIWNKYDILRTGQEFKFKVNPVDPYDAFRGRYVSLGYRDPLLYSNGKYGTVVIAEDGFAKLDKITVDKPAEGVYVKSIRSNHFIMPIDRYYMEEKMAPKAERIAWSDSGKSTYVTARIKNGGLVITGLFIDGVAIEDMIENK